MVEGAECVCENECVFKTLAGACTLMGSACVCDVAKEAD